MDDTLNEFTTFIDAYSSKQNGGLDFTIVDEGMGWYTIDAHFDSRDSPIETDVGVTDDSLNEIRKRFKSIVTTFVAHGVVQVNEQLTYTLLPEAKCTKDEIAMIHYMAVEWLYYG